MAQVKVRVTASDIVTINTNNYVSQWQEKCDDDGDMEEGDDYPEVPEDFAVAQFTEDLEDGTEDLSVIDGGTIEVVRV